MSLLAGEHDIQVDLDDGSTFCGLCGISDCDDDWLEPCKANKKGTE